MSCSETVSEAPLSLDSRIRRFRCGDEVDTFVFTTERWLVIVDTHSTPALALQLAEQCAEPDDAGRLIVINTTPTTTTPGGTKFSAVRTLRTPRRSSVTCSGPSD